jgi:ribosome biogenesis GTPase A
MRVRYSFSSRRTGRVDTDNKHRRKFPEIVSEVLADSDIILEILDARFIEETRNPEIEKEAREKGKKIIFVLNKADLVDEREVKKKLDIRPYVFVSCKSRRGSGKLRDRIKIEAKSVRTESKRVRVGVIGYPNTGKSSVINLITGKSAAKVAAEAGFTKGIQKIKLSEGIVILDTPGVIPERENSNINKRDLVKHTKISVRMHDKVKEPELVVHELMRQNKGVFESFYDIEADGNSEVLIEELGKRKGMLRRGGLVDSDRVSRAILKDWQEGRIKA